MSFVRRFSVKFLVCMFILVAVSSLFAIVIVTPPTTILVRSDGIGQPNVPVLCTQTGTVVNTAATSTSVDGVVTSVGTARFNWPTNANGVTDRSKFKAYVGGAWHNCLDDCDGPSPAVNHFHCELPPTISLKVVNAASYPGGVANVSIRITNLSDVDLGYPNSSYPSYTKPKTNLYGYVTVCPPADTSFKIWSKENGSTVWKHAGTFSPLTEDTDYTFSLNTTLTNPQQGDYVDGTSVTFEWLPRVQAKYSEFFIIHESWAGWLDLGYTTGTDVTITSLPQGAWMWAIDSYDSAGNYLGTSSNTEFYVY